MRSPILIARTVGSSILDGRDQIVVAWFLIVAGSGFIALFFSYHEIWWGSVIFYYTFLINLVTTYPKSRVRGHNAKLFVAVTIVILTLFVHSVIIHGIELVATDFGAAQVVALAALASRAANLLRTHDSLDVVFEDPDPMTHPFITVSATVTFLLGLLGFAGRRLLERFGIEVASSGSSLLFFLLITFGASTGLVAYLVEGPRTAARS